VKRAARSALSWTDVALYAFATAIAVAVTIAAVVIELWLNA
jgi:hypothetical protein